MISHADREALKKSFEQVMTLFSAPTKDWHAFVELVYERDAIVMAPHAAAVEGHQAIIAFWQAFPPISDFKQQSLEMEGFGDLAYLRDQYSVAVTLPGNVVFRDTGKVITIYRKQTDGSWKIFREIWNSDLPVPAA